MKANTTRRLALPIPTAYLLTDTCNNTNNHHQAGPGRQRRNQDALRLRQRADPAGLAGGGVCGGAATGAVCAGRVQGTHAC